MLIAIVFLLVCVLGCGKSAQTPTGASTAPANTATPNQPVANTDVAGHYDVTGTNEDGSPYKGALEIIKHGDAYQFRWNAGKEYDGVGVENGSVLAVTFTEGTDGKGCGVVTYKVLGDGTLDGKWGFWGVNEAGAEKAKHTKGIGLTGDYAISGANPDGKAYGGTLAVTASGGGYKFIWSNGSEGYGISRGETVTVGVGGSRCAFVAYEIKANGMLDGVWGGYGSEKTGTEKATKKN